MTLVCLSACLPASLSVCLSVCLSVSLSVCLPICLSPSLSVCLSFCLSVSLSVSLSVCLSTSLFVSVSLSAYLSLCPPAVFPSVCLSVCHVLLSWSGGDSRHVSLLRGVPTGCGHTQTSEYAVELRTQISHCFCCCSLDAIAAASRPL
ncbi:unnamed protein product [Gadus morhua 'NCC']